MNLCPICQLRQTYKINRKVKTGETIKTKTGYIFKQTGEIEVKEEYWTCKKCANRLSAKEYNDALINYFNNKNKQKQLL
jgi:hypothetical protein